MLKVFTRKFGDVAVLSVQGRIVVGNGIKTLREAVLRQTNVSTIILDLARVSTIDAGGLGAMLEILEQVQSNGTDFKLMNVRYLVSRLLAMTRLDSVFNIVSEAEVLSPRRSAKVEAVVSF